jgi:hypothetical protein
MPNLHQRKMTQQTLFVLRQRQLHVWKGISLAKPKPQKKHSGHYSSHKQHL